MTFDLPSLPNLLDRPDLIDYNSLRPAQHITNLNNAFDIAEKELGLPRLLDAEGVCVYVYVYYVCVWCVVVCVCMHEYCLCPVSIYYVLCIIMCTMCV